MPTLTWTRSKPAPVESQPPPAEQRSGRPTQDVPPIASGSAQSVSWLATRALSLLLLGCLLAGPVALALVVGSALGGSPSSTTTTAAPAEDRSGERAIAGQFAEQLVTAWLTSTSDHPEPLHALVPTAAVPVGAREAFAVTDPAVAGIEAVGEGWSVTVAASVTDARDVSARRFYQVPVQVSGSSVVALSLPTVVAGPALAPAPASAYRAQIPTGTPLGVAVSEFLSAWLAGGEISRYLTPAVTLSPPVPPPFTAAHVDELRTADDDVDPAAAPTDGQLIRVLASVTASVTDQQAVATDFAVSLTARAGRWEISGIDPAPAQSTDLPVPAAAPAAAGSTTPPTS